jgi:acylphosphatase
MRAGFSPRAPAEGSMRLRVSYQGRVQGVGFRATARAVAATHAVSGFVRNEPDGSVLLELQGEPAEVDACLAAIARRMGPRILRCERTPCPERGDERGFRIEH